jgi:hypothetical protein
MAVSTPARLIRYSQSEGLEVAVPDAETKTTKRSLRWLRHEGLPGLFVL